MDIGKGDAKKARYWQQTLGEAARSGMSIREFCRRRRLKESQFYWWQRRLRVGEPERTISNSGGGEERRASPWSARKPGRRTPGSSWCGAVDGDCAFGREWMKRHGGPYWRLWSQADAEFSGGDQSLPVYRAVRHAPLVRRLVDDGRTCDWVQPLCRFSLICRLREPNCQFFSVKSRQTHPR
jgi:hypothetical protein